MTKLSVIIRNTYLFITLGFVATIVLPTSLLVASASAVCVPPDDTTAGIHRPVGSDASAFTYNCDTGLWESAHYIYDPSTGLTTPKEPPTYIYNPSTGKYDITTWVYDAPTGSYVSDTSSVAKPPIGALVVGAPVVIADPITTTGTSPSGNSISNTGAGSNNTINNNGGVTSGSGINGTGPNSNNNIDGSANNNTNGTNNTTAGMNNTITASANTGNALTIGNTTAGGAQSGNAQDIANVVNLLQSSSNALDGNTVTFVANIDGDVNGDLFFDPAAAGAVQPAAATGSVGNNNLTLDNSTNATINNNINLDADSGDATVADNTSGGDATSGAATTIANVVNLINSAITSGKSFLGVININGNLNGDILVPDDFVQQLIADNVPTVTIDTTGPNSNNDINENNGSDNTNITNTNNQGITNKVNASADSGQAGVSGNTSGGDATSGSAATNITAFNLTGSQVVGRNSILVFVNVVGQWVGLIVNAPPGTTAAELGGGITSDSSQANNDTTINNNDNQTINNNITTAAKSGSANVTDNTKGGNAKSGSANGAVNLLNVENSSLSLSGYFGILFINVFGTWHGSFGINTSAGDPVAAAAGQSGGSNSGVASLAPTQFASFLPKSGNAQFNIGGAGANSGQTNAATGNSSGNSINAVLAASTSKVGSNTPTPALAQTQSDFKRTAAIISGFVVLIILADAYRGHRAANKAGISKS